MNSQAQEHWHCTNPECGAETPVEAEASADSAGSESGSGEQIKRSDKPAVFHYLDFLREDECTAESGEKAME